MTTPEAAFATINAASLDCPECGEPVFIRPPGVRFWADGEKATCGDCGARLRVSVEEDDDGDEDGEIVTLAFAEIDEEDHDA